MAADSNVLNGAAEVFEPLLQRPEKKRAYKYPGFKRSEPVDYPMAASSRH